MRHILTTAAALVVLATSTNAFAGGRHRENVLVGTFKELFSFASPDFRKPECAVGDLCGDGYLEGKADGTPTETPLLEAGMMPETCVIPNLRAKLDCIATTHKAPLPQPNPAAAVVAPAAAPATKAEPPLAIAPSIPLPPQQPTPKVKMYNI